MKCNAKIINYGIATTKEGLPCVVINFKVKKGENDYVDMMWQGSLKEGRAQEITIDALITCGLRSGDLASLSRNTGLDKEKVVSVVIEKKEYNGRTFDEIKWINEVYEGKEMLAEKDAVQKLSGLNLSGSIMARLIELGKIKKEIQIDEIPF